MSEESPARLIITDIPYIEQPLFDKLLMDMYGPDPFNLVQRDPFTGMASVEFIGSILTLDPTQKRSFGSWVALSETVTKYHAYIEATSNKKEE